MAVELTFDLVEEILVRLDVEDVIRCKSVCKSWYSFISCPRFVKAHLNHTCMKDRNNPKLGHRRISMPSITAVDCDLLCNCPHIVGSCDGLVCVSPFDFELVVTNPSTREERKLQTPPHGLHPKNGMIRELLCWGFGYDPSIDDYKVIAGFREYFSSIETRFYALTLKSNTWKVIGQVNYRSMDGVDGVLCGGALHWYMSDKTKKVILSIDLSTHEFKEIPQPPLDQEYLCDVSDDEDFILGVIDECLCIYWDIYRLPSKTWVMKNNKWERYNNNDHCETKHDVAHFLFKLKTVNGYVYTHRDAERVPTGWYYVRASIFVKSLVSPHPHFCSNNKSYEGQKSNIIKQGQEGNAVCTCSKWCQRQQKK